MPFCQPQRTITLAFRCSIWTRFANVNMWVKFLSRNYTSFQNLHQIPILSSIYWGLQFVSLYLTFCPCLTSFPQRNCDIQTTTKFPLARNVTCHVKGPFYTRLRDVNMTRRLLLLCAKKKIHVELICYRYAIEWADNLNFSFLPCSFTDLRLVIPERV